MKLAYRGERSIARHVEAHCLNGAECNGPGCRVATGKTARKGNPMRSHPNKRNVQPEVVKPNKRSK